MGGLIDLVVPREHKFFELLQKKCTLLLSCSKKLAAVTKTATLKHKFLKEAYAFIQKNNAKSEELSFALVSALHQTFITPIDRDELLTLSTVLDRIGDSLEKITAALTIFTISRLDSFLQKQLQLTTSVIETLVPLFVRPLDKKVNPARIRTIRACEKEADMVYHHALETLFRKENDAILIMKKKELYDRIEEAVDEAKSIADTMESILINHT